MPVEDYEELSLEGMNVDTVGDHYDILVSKFGGGRRRSARVGQAFGLKIFVLSPVVLTDHSNYNDLIETQPSFQYYYDFWTERMQAGNEPFILEWRSKKYTVVFRSHDFSYETFTSDLFAAGVELEQVDVEGEAYESDGSVTPTEEP